MRSSINLLKLFFSGTVNSASAHPREVVKLAIELNTCAVILSRNHPSCNTELSESDLNLTNKLKSALDTIDIRILDHIIVGKDYSSLVVRRLT